VLVGTFGVLLSVYVTPANTSDQEGARRLLAGLNPLQPRLELIWADSAYRGDVLARWCATEGAWRLEIIARATGPGVCGPAVALDRGTHAGQDRTAAALE
jgi:putative transposase